MKEQHLTDQLSELRERSPRLELRDGMRLVVFSDMHLGDRGSRDDFLRNSRLFLRAAEGYYLRGGYGLVLNGDIEELQKFSLARIKSAWPEIYELFARFAERSLLVRIRGNHDEHAADDEACDGLRLLCRSGEIFIFHGHQASFAFNRLNGLFGFLLRYLAAPLGIKNYSVSRSNTRKFKTEKRVYNFSSRERIISLIGHTHRPLFESLSKTDTLKYRIEELCRRYPGLNGRRREQTGREIVALKTEYLHLCATNGDAPGNLYGNGLLVPCMFNSGCTVGKRGMTAVEIEEDSIRLVHWFNRGVSRRFLEPDAQFAAQETGGGTFRVVIKEDPLDYIFTRIRLLA